MTKIVRKLHVSLKTAKGRKNSSQIWLNRNVNDQYNQQLKKDNYRSRSAYKLIDIQKKFTLLKSGLRVLDLGSSPGGWSQIAAKYVTPKNNKSYVGVYAVDIVPMLPLDNVVFMQKDFISDFTEITETLDGKVDLILCDMDPAFCGDKTTDHLKSINLCEAALEGMPETLKHNGNAVIKSVQGCETQSLKNKMASMFDKVHTIKPDASRKDSNEFYFVCLGYNGQ